MKLASHDTLRRGTDQKNNTVIGPSIKGRHPEGFIRGNPNEHLVKKPPSLSERLTDEGIHNEFQKDLANTINVNDDKIFSNSRVSER